MLKGQTPGQTLHQTVWTKSVKKKSKRKRKKYHLKNSTLKKPQSIFFRQEKKKTTENKWVNNEIRRIKGDVKTLDHFPQRVRVKECFLT